MASRFRKLRTRKGKSKGLKTRKHKGGFFGLFGSSSPTPAPAVRSKENIKSNIDDKVGDYILAMGEVIKAQDQLKVVKAPAMVNQLQTKITQIKGNRLAGLRENIKKLDAELKAVDPSSNYLNANVRKALEI